MKFNEGLSIIVGVVVVMILLATGNLLSFGGRGEGLRLSLNSGASASQTLNTEGNSNVLLNGGVITQDVRIGNGPKIEPGSIVSIHYVGGFEDGSIFDSSLNRGEPIQFMIGAGEVIPGLDAGLMSMQPGGVRIIRIAPEYAYGEAGIGPIPPNTPLIFEVELIDVLSPVINSAVNSAEE